MMVHAWSCRQVHDGKWESRCLRCKTTVITDFDDVPTGMRCTGVKLTQGEFEATLVMES